MRILAATPVFGKAQIIAVSPRVFKMDRVYNFGIIGAGVIGNFHAQAVNSLSNARLRSICDNNLDRAISLAHRYGVKAFQDYNEMLNDMELDIVTIATPSGLHLEPSIAAAKAHKHVLCEKPLEITPDRIDKMISAHKEAGTQLGCILQTRYTPALQPLRDAVMQQRFGTITYAGVYVPWWRTDEYYNNSWHGTWNLDGGGALMNQSIHMIDMLCSIMPEVKSVMAYTNSIGHPGIEAEDTAVATLKFVNGALGVIYGSTASYPGQLKRFEISGTRGTVIYIEDSYLVFEFQDKRSEDNEVMRQFEKVKGQSGTSDPAAIPHELHALCFKDFITALETKKTFWIDGQQAKKSVELIHAIYESSKKSGLVSLVS